MKVVDHKNIEIFNGNTLSNDRYNHKDIFQFDPRYRGDFSIIETLPVHEDLYISVRVRSRFFEKLLLL